MLHKLPINRTESRALVHQKIYKFINDCGFPAVTVEKPQFRKLLDCVCVNSSNLNTADFDLSHKAITKIRLRSYNLFVRTVNSLSKNVRDFYKGICGKPIWFATITHDIWKGFHRDVLGVLMFFMDPCNCRLYKMPIGLVYTEGHEAQHIVQLTTNLLLLFGFSKLDLVSAINDNTNGAVLISKYLIDHAGKDGDRQASKCNMHKAELILKHATGMAKQRRGGIIVDSFEDFVALNKTFQGFASWLMNSKRTDCFQKYRHTSFWNSWVVIQLQLPNTTRIAK